MTTRGRNTALAGTAVAGGLGYALGCWLARLTSYGTRRESAELAPAGRQSASSVG